MIAQMLLNQLEKTAGLLLFILDILLSVLSVLLSPQLHSPFSNGFEPFTLIIHKRLYQQLINRVSKVKNLVAFLLESFKMRRAVDRGTRLTSQIVDLILLRFHPGHIIL